MGSKKLTDSTAWKALEAHHNEIKDEHLRQLFADDPERAKRLRSMASGFRWTIPRTGSRLRPWVCCSTSPRSAA